MATGILDGVVYVEANNSVTVKMNVKRQEAKERGYCYIYSPSSPISYRTYPRQGWDDAEEEEEEEEERKYLETNKQTRIH